MNGVCIKIFFLQRASVFIFENKQIFEEDVFLIISNIYHSEMGRNERRSEVTLNFLKKKIKKGEGSRVKINEGRIKKKCVSAWKVKYPDKAVYGMEEFYDGDKNPILFLSCEDC